MTTCCVVHVENQSSWNYNGGSTTVSGPVPDARGPISANRLARVSDDSGNDLSPMSTTSQDQRAQMRPMMCCSFVRVSHQRDDQVPLQQALVLQRRTGFRFVVLRPPPPLFPFFRSGAGSSRHSGPFLGRVKPSALASLRTDSLVLAAASTTAPFSQCLSGPVQRHHSGPAT